MECSIRKIRFFIGKKKRDFEVDYLILRTPIFSVFLTQSTFVLKEGLEKLRLVFWIGKRNQITKQVFLWWN